MNGEIEHRFPAAVRLFAGISPVFFSDTIYLRNRHVHICGWLLLRVLPYSDRQLIEFVRAIPLLHTRPIGIGIIIAARRPYILPSIFGSQIKVPGIKKQIDLDIGPDFLPLL